MQNDQQWIWQLPSWPNFHYSPELLLASIATASRLIGALEATCRTLADPILLDTQQTVLADDAMETSAIEGEALRRSSVRASVCKQLGLPVGEDDSDSRSDGLVAMLLDARNNASQPLTRQRLCAWQAALFPTGYSGLRQIRVGGYRGREEMQIVSGPVDKEHVHLSDHRGKRICNALPTDCKRLQGAPDGRKRPASYAPVCELAADKADGVPCDRLHVHYIAPPRDRLDQEMSLFFSFVNQANGSDPILKAGIAHLWFIMIHPFDDGNGRVGRAITDSLLSRSFPLLMQAISFSKQVSLDKKNYYRLLEEAGRGGLEITDWLLWFVQTLTTSLHQSQWIIEQVVNKTHFWRRHGKTALNPRQQKVLNRLLGAGDQFIGGMTTRKYAGMCKCSKVSASRDLADLETKGLVRKRPGGGRSTSYEIVL